MNSEVTNWSMQRLYPYVEFKQMPKDLQAEYVTGLINRYNITASAVARELFGITDTCFRKYMLQRDIYEKIPMRKGFRSSKESIDRFRDDILNSFGPEKVAKQEEPKHASATSFDSLVRFSAKLKGCRLSMDGFDSEIFEFLAKKYAGQNVSVTLLVEIKGSPVMEISNAPAIGLTTIP